MQVLEITGNRTGIAQDGVNFLEPVDAYQEMIDGFIYRQIVQSRLGFSQFSLTSVTNNPANLVADGTRIMGIFEFILRDGTTQLLVCSKYYLYFYNAVTNLFVQIPFTSAVAPPITGFTIINNEDYVSGTTYPFPDGSDRFVFSSRGMTDVWMYDLTGVKRFTLVADNPDYVPPLDIYTGAPGVLNNALHVIAFGGRLCLFAPTINSNTHQDSVLWTAAQDAGGDGDSFVAPGAGEQMTDSDDFINTATILGDVVISNFNRSNWALQQTKDPFNKFFWRRISSPIGSDAAFSFATWFNQEFAIGQTGMITTDARQVKRFDDKYPYFTRDEISQVNTQLTYGGFDRFNAQFLFSYMADGSTLNNTQSNAIIFNYEEESFSIYNMRFSCFGQCVVGQNLVWNDIYEVNNPSWLRWDTTEEIWNKIGIGSGLQKTLAGDDLGFVYELNQDFDDYFSTITGITNAAQAVITCSPQGLMIGDKVSIRDVSGMIDINDNLNPDDNWLQIVAITSTTVTVDFDSTLSPVYTGEGSISKIIEFSATTIPFNPFRSQGLRVYVGFVEFLLDCNAGYLDVSVFADGQQSPIREPVRIFPQAVAPTTQLIPVSKLPINFPDGTQFYTTNLLTIPQEEFDLPSLTPGTIQLIFDPAPGLNTTIYEDDGAGNIVKISGTFGFSSGTINYLTGIVNIDFGLIDIPGVTIPVIANFTFQFDEYGADLINDRAWVTMSVDQEADFITFQMQQQSATNQVRLYSTRIHYMQGGRTSG